MEEASSKDLIAKRIHPYTKHLYSSIPKLGERRTTEKRSTRFGEVPDPTVPPVPFPEDEQSAAPAVDFDQAGEGHYVSPHFTEQLIS
jgi:ABC-type oligopeptide transport system ATPase subunit